MTSWVKNWFVCWGDDKLSEELVVVFVCWGDDKLNEEPGVFVCWGDDKLSKELVCVLRWWQAEWRTSCCVYVSRWWQAEWRPGCCVCVLRWWQAEWRTGQLILVRNAGCSLTAAGRQVKDSITTPQGFSSSLLCLSSTLSEALTLDSCHWRELPQV